MLTPLLLGTSLLSAHGEWIYDRNGLHDENGNKPVDKSQITSVKFSNNVTHIGDAAFYGCSALKNITIPNSVTSIGGRAFSGCSALVNITLPNTVTRIGDDAFTDCRALTSITLPRRFEGQERRIGIPDNCNVQYSE